MTPNLTEHRAVLYGEHKGAFIWKTDNHELDFSERAIASDFNSTGVQYEAALVGGQRTHHNMLQRSGCEFADILAATPMPQMERRLRSPEFRRWQASLQCFVVISAYITVGK